MSAPPAPDEMARLAALHNFKVLDTAPEPEFDDLTRLAATLCGTPISLVSLIDTDRQWFKSRVGLDACETPRDMAFCSHAIRQSDLYVVPDAREHPLFRDNPLVTREPYIRFYAGSPLIVPGGHAIGTLCVIDRAPRQLSVEQRDALRVLARQVVAQLLLRRQVQILESEVADRNRAEAALRESEGRFRAFMDHGPAVAYIKDPEGRFVYVNEPLIARFPEHQGNWLGKTDHDFFPAEFADKYREHDLQILSSGGSVVYPEASPSHDGTLIEWRSYKFALTDRNGQRYLAGMSVDVTAEKKVADALLASESKFKAVVNRLNEGIYLVDNATGAHVEANAAILDLLGYSNEEFAKLTPFDLIAGDDRQAIAAIIATTKESLTRQGRYNLGLQKYRRKDGSEINVEVRAAFVPHGEAGLASFFVRDVTEQIAYENRLFEYQSNLEEANARLKSLAVTDGLTGVKNRAALNEMLFEEFDRATRYGRPLSVILLDVDHFKPFNDTFGHPAGDAVLQSVASILKKTARATDVVARYGGEEFAVILPETDLAGAMIVAERCRRAIDGESWDKRPITASLGVATMTSATEAAPVLLREADEALYTSKRTGRNRVTHNSGCVAWATVRS
jgi:diguanylate cyclase (GGDEF)-like protein/PAS domain S-box-containing protein